MNVEKYNMPVAEVISEIIEEKCLKKRAVAQKIGVTDQQLCAMLKGRKIIKACDIMAIANALDVTPNELFRIVSDKTDTP